MEKIFISRAEYSERYLPMVYRIHSHVNSLHMHETKVQELCEAMERRHTRRTGNSNAAMIDHHFKKVEFHQLQIDIRSAQLKTFTDQYDYRRDQRSIDVHKQEPENQIEAKVKQEQDDAPMEVDIKQEPTNEDDVKEEQMPDLIMPDLIKSEPMNY